MIRSTVATAALLAFSALAALPAGAQDAFPSKPVRIVVTFAAGGGPDIMARIVGQKLAANIGQAVVIDNKVGATGIIGADIVAHSPADGYTILLGTPAPLSVAGGSGRKLNYDPLKDFAWITQGVLLTPIMVVAPNAPYKTVADLIAAARAKPGAMTYASAGIGNSQHLAGELFKQMAGIDTLHVPYQSGVMGMAAIASGQTNYFFSDPSALPQVRSGRLRALAVTTLKRSAQLPDTPTVSESGLPGYEYSNWYGFLVPAKTPKPVVQRLFKELTAVLQAADVKEKLVSAGMEPAPSASPEEMDGFLARDQEKWARVVKAAKITFD
ncbi:MAG: tripartite tricarboxylate transporter substrate binding protein [Proteobacteria bacterium]|nr:tripartite tricarboxylate transporter substrate binding protein [Pseudomonadota bacterium]